MKADGVELSVTDQGDGPAVLFLHGFPDRGDLWRHQIEGLSTRFRCIAPDLRGFGDSERPDDVSEYRVGRSVADMVVLLDTLEIERAHVVGHDWGAGVAWAMALLAPERVDKLAVLSVGHPAVPLDLAQREKSWYILLFQFEEAEALMARDDWALFRQWAASHPDLERALADLSRPGALTAALNWYRANLHPRDELAGLPPLPPVQADTLAIWSSGDAYLNECQMIESPVERWRYERIHGAGHWIPLDAPQRVNELLLDHLC